MDHACLVVTDLGGIQEGTTVLGVPWLTPRSSTERPIAVEDGTSRLVGLDAEADGAAIADMLGADGEGAGPGGMGREGCRAHRGHRARRLGEVARARVMHTRLRRESEGS